MMAYIQYPEWLHPEIIPGFPVRWYGLMYLVAFVIAFFLLRKQMAERDIPSPNDEAMNLITWGIIGLLLGARIFATIVYDDTVLYLTHPWLIFWPFDSHMHFTGFQGMSYHGGVIGGALGVLFYSIRHKQSFFANADMMVTAIPFGYFFGRIGNFINAELYGRVTDSPIGMMFPGQDQPRHPSQLYEAFFEGLFLGILMWFVFRKMKLKDGVRTGLYLFCYGFIRFFIEYFREPDADLGFILLNFTMGQLLCLLMMMIGVSFILIRSRKTT